MAIYDLYGFSSDDLKETKNLLEAALGIHFDARDSTYEGGDYFHHEERDGEDFMLKRNVDPFDDEPAELFFPTYPILLYVNHTLRSENLQQKLAQVEGNLVLLRHEDLQ